MPAAWRLSIAIMPGALRLSAHDRGNQQSVLNLSLWERLIALPAVSGSEAVIIT